MPLDTFSGFDTILPAVVGIDVTICDATNWGGLVNTPAVTVVSGEAVGSKPGKVVVVGTDVSNNDAVGRAVTTKNDGESVLSSLIAGGEVCSVLTGASVVVTGKGVEPALSGADVTLAT